MAPAGRAGPGPSGFSFGKYLLWTTLELWLAELAPLTVVEVILPLSSGRALRRHGRIHPDDRPRILLARLGLILPRRLGLPRLGDAGAQHDVLTRAGRHV